MLWRILRPLFLSRCVLTLAGWSILAHAETNRTVTLTRAPSIQQCSADSAVICWKTDLPVASTLQYSLDLNYGLQVRDTALVNFHTVRLRGLQSDRTYNYRIVADGTILHTSAFRTYPKPQDARYRRFSFWGIGDSGSGDSNQVAIRDQIQKLVDEGRADFGIHTGDLVYPEGGENNQDPRFFTPYQSIIDKQVCWPVLGNHDRPQVYFNNRVLPEPDTLANPTNPERWYAFTYGPAVFIALDSENPSNSTQLNFLRLMLERHRNKLWKFVIFHHPPYANPYSDSVDCSHHSEREVRSRFCRTLEEYEVDVVFTGHNHSYQRSLLRKDHFPERRGVCYIVTGGGGAEVATVDSFDARCNNPPLQQAAVKSNTHHLIHVKVDRLTLSLQAIDKAGRVFDTFEIRKDTIAEVGNAPGESMPRAITLNQNYPNPLRRAHNSTAKEIANTAIEFSLARKEKVSLIIFDVMGKEVCRLVDEELAAGAHVRYWQGTDKAGVPVSPGIYFYQLTAGNQSTKRRMLIME